MKQSQLQKLTGAFKQGFYAGTVLSFMVYVFARILFYEFTFTAWEEISNFFLIIVTGGLIVGAVVIAFLLMEMVLTYLSTVSISLPALSLKRRTYIDDTTVGAMDEMQTAA